MGGRERPVVDMILSPPMFHATRAELSERYVAYLPISTNAPRCSESRSGSILIKCKSAYLVFSGLGFESVEVGMLI